MKRFNSLSSTRRAICVGLGAGAPLSVLIATRRLSKSRPKSGLVEIGDLVDAEGAATALARRKLGERIIVSGFYAPALRDGALFNLYERTLAPCLLCGLTHDPGAAIAVLGPDRPELPSLRAPTEVAGRLELGPRGAPRLAMG